jgi:hypothetical protein
VNRSFCALGFSALLLASSVRGELTSQDSHPDEVASHPTTATERRAAQAYRDGCPEVCEQHEACVQHRCIEMCRPDCRQGTYCNSAGSCEANPEPSQVILTEAERQSLSGLASKDSRWLLFVDLGGIVGYGARPGIEYGILNSILLRLHLLNTGIMSHATFVENENERFEWGFGASLGYRHYESTWGNLRGFYFGGGVDYSISLIGSRGEADLSQLRQTAAPFGEFGYRWVFGGFALGFGPTLALRYPVSVGTFGSDKDLCTSEIDCEDTARRLEGTVNLELGWFQ